MTIEKDTGKNDEVLPEELDDIDFYDSGSVTFKFVGIVMVGDYVIRCYPKYIVDSELSSDFSGKFNNAMLAIRKYNKLKQKKISNID